MTAKNNKNCPAVEMMMEEKTVRKEILFHGVPASHGIAIGRVYFLRVERFDFTPKTNIRRLSEEQSKEELSKFENVIRLADSELGALSETMKEAGKTSEAEIFSVQRMFLVDPSFITPITNMVTKKHWPVEEAINVTVSELSASFALLEGDFFKERILDIKDVALRLLRLLSNDSEHSDCKHEMPEDCILFAEDILPSKVAQLDLKATKGIIMKSGSKTCHAAILARSLGIPVITGLSSIFSVAKDGDELLLDGYLGLAILNPIRDTVECYKEKIGKKDRIRHKLIEEITLPTITTDGVKCQVEANLGNLDDCVFAVGNHAAGVGLFRTEFLYMDSATMPDEEAQYKVYCDLLHAMPGQTVTIRTFDFGGDKVSKICNFKESNPFLGMRAIRLHRLMPELLRVQLTALLRAGTEGDLRIMFPMVTTMHEIDEILTLKNEIMSFLEYQKIPFNPSVKFGIMIEIPSAAIMADSFAQKMDFFSIGTNDLVQYTLAVDRTNDNVQHLFKTCHPSVLRLIKLVADAANKNHIDVSVCGEMGGNPLFVPLLIGLGIKQLSMSPSAIPAVAGLVRRISLADSQKLADFALKSRYTEPIIAESKDFIHVHAPDIFSLIN